MANTTWEPGTVSAVTLSGGNLIATNTGTTSTNQGAHGLTTDGQTAGKYYFEVTYTTTTGGANVGVGIGTPTSTYAGMGQSGAVVGVEVFGNIYTNGTSTGIAVGPFFIGQICCAAFDLSGRLMWFRKGAAGLWNNSGTANPATGVGGVTIPAGTMIPFVTFGGSAGSSGNVLTANFGDSAFSGAVPAGFTSGFPVGGGAAATMARAMVLA